MNLHKVIIVPLYIFYIINNKKYLQQLIIIIIILNKILAHKKVSIKDNDGSESLELSY